MEAKESIPEKDQGKIPDPEDSKIQSKPQKKDKIKKGDRKKRGKNDTDPNEEEKYQKEINTLSLADIEAIKHKDKNKEKGKSISSILEENKIDEEMINKLSAEERRGECDIRVAIIGNVDSGKSTLVGVLSKGELDDGRGSARLKVFNFTHEAENGRTSSIGQEIMGFDEEGKWVEPERVTATKNQTWSHITEHSKKLITFIDLCGHEKYLKTTMFGMVGLMPDYCLIVIGANMGIARMTREHLVIALALRIPIFVAITKTDIAPEEVYEKTKTKLQALLESKSAGKKVAFVKENDSDLESYAKDLAVGDLCPIFCVSNVSGEGITEMKTFMKLLTSRIYLTGKFRPPYEPVEMLIDGFYMVTGVGGVVAGTLTSGKVTMGDQLMLGPDSTGQFKPVVVRGIHYKRTNVEEVVSGQVCCFNIKPVGKKEQMKRSIFRKGMVLLGADANPQSTWEFTAEIVILHNPTTIKPGYQAVIHCGVIRQAAKIVSISKEYLRMGDKGYVHFRFMYRPEYLKEGVPFMMREGRTKGLGTICTVVRETNVEEK